MGQLSENPLRNNPLFERFAREGRKEGTLTGLHHSLLLVLQTRGLRVTEAQRASGRRMTRRCWRRG